MSLQWERDAKRPCWWRREERTAPLKEKVVACDGKGEEGAAVKRAAARVAWPRSGHPWSRSPSHGGEGGCAAKRIVLYNKKIMVMMMFILLQLFMNFLSFINI
jgi:hypothetical protein